MAVPNISKALWRQSKADIRKAIKEADEVHMFIDPGYFAWCDKVPRVKVTASYALDFMANRHKMPNDHVPGIEFYEFEGKKALALYPSGWEFRHDDG